MGSRIGFLSIRQTNRGATKRRERLFNFEDEKLTDFNDRDMLHDYPHRRYTQGCLFVCN